MAAGFTATAVSGGNLGVRADFQPAAKPHRNHARPSVLSLPSTGTASDKLQMAETVTGSNKGLNRANRGFHASG